MIICVRKMIGIFVEAFVTAWLLILFKMFQGYMVWNLALFKILSNWRYLWQHVLILKQECEVGFGFLRSHWNSSLQKYPTFYIIYKEVTKVRPSSFNSFYFLFHFQLQWKPFKNGEKYFLIHLKSSFRSQDI